MSLEFRRRVSLAVLAVLCALPATGALCAALCPAAAASTPAVASTSGPTTAMPACHGHAGTTPSGPSLASAQGNACSSHRVDPTAIQATAVDTRLTLLPSPSSLVVVVGASFPPAADFSTSNVRPQPWYPPAPAGATLVLRI